MQTPFSPPSFGKSFMKIRSAVPENGCLILMHYRCGGRKNICKTYMHPRRLAVRMHKQAVNYKLRMCIQTAETESSIKR